MISGTTLREMQAADWPRVAEIWAEGIATGIATFETEPPSWEVFDATRHRAGRLVAEHDGAVVGWTALSPVSSRACYAGVAENSVYVATAAQGLGVGTALMRALVREAAAAGIWTIQCSVFPENTASRALHERAGFRVVGRRERIAQLDGVWRDTLFLELRLPDCLGEDGTTRASG
jgi:phosphinothricin acetyltransferase